MRATGSGGPGPVAGFLRSVVPLDRGPVAGSSSVAMPLMGVRFGRGTERP